MKINKLYRWMSTTYADTLRDTSAHTHITNHTHIQHPHSHPLSIQSMFDRRKTLWNLYIIWILGMWQNFSQSLKWPHSHILMSVKTPAFVFWLYRTQILSLTLKILSLTHIHTCTYSHKTIPILTHFSFYLFDKRTTTELIHHVDCRNVTEFWLKPQMTCTNLNFDGSIKIVVFH